ncbi:uncharacterized protein LOC141607267 [Silene latifolia]|uniref:uncharacterized protein LOC141607267 n=1 Tax=Silene latifolia TaxID=37657 RepID=UPI003D785107
MEVDMGNVEAAGVMRGEQGQWTKPEQGFVKLNIDAGVKEGWGMGVGVVCRGNNGEVVWGLSEHRREELEPKLAESMAILEGIKEARSRGHSNIIIESDCKSVIDALKKKEHGQSDFHLILDDIFYFCSAFNSVIWSFVSRKLNSVAHELAHYSSSEIGRQVWDSLLPEQVMSLVTRNINEMR